MGVGVKCWERDSGICMGALRRAKIRQLVGNFQANCRELLSVVKFGIEALGPMVDV